MVLHSFYWPHGGGDVKVSGEFDNWSGTTSMQRTEQDGHFVKVIDLPASTKVYYKFIVDGHWCVDGQASKEGHGAHENNYVLTGAAQETASARKGDETDGDLPVLGHGASYASELGIDMGGATDRARGEATNGSSLGRAMQYDLEEDDVDAQASVRKIEEIETTTTKDTVEPDVVSLQTEGTAVVAGAPSDAQSGQKDTPARVDTPSAPAILPTTEEVRQELSAVASEVKHEIEHVAEVAGGLLTAGVAASAAFFGLSNRQSHTEASPITGKTVAEPQTVVSSLQSFTNPTSRAEAIPSETVAAEAEVTDAIPAATKSAESTTSDAVRPSETGTLEQAAVAAATTAATNAYNASGLTGLTGLAPAVSSISKDGEVGFTGIGTAVNQETGVIGTSKIVQGVDDLQASEETQSGRLASGNPGSLLQDHENGAKVERINEHAVMAEVGIGGAAIGTAVVTDQTVSSTEGLDIPAQAAEHLQSHAVAADTTDAVSTAATTASRPALDSFETDLAPSLGREITYDDPVVDTTDTAQTVTSTTSSKAVELPSEVARVSPVDVVPATGTTTTITSSTVVGPEIPISSADLPKDITTAPAAVEHASAAASPEIRTSTPASPAKAPSSIPAPVKSSSTAASPEMSNAPAAVPAKVAGTQSVPVVGVAKDLDSSRPTTAATKASEATSYETAKTSAASPTLNSPSKAAAQAASKNSAMRQSMRGEQVQATEASAAPSTASNNKTAVPSSPDLAGKKKKNPFLRRMKTIFGGSKN